MWRSVATAVSDASWRSSGSTVTCETIPICIGYDGCARITDFGISKALHAVSQVTTGGLKGTLAYMSPEQLRYDGLDRRTDLFSFGVVLYELLAGSRLYADRSDGLGGEDSTPQRILREPPPDIGELRPELPPELVELSFELLAKDREHRPATANAVALRLEAMLAPCVAEEGPLEVGSYLWERFSAERRNPAQWPSPADAVGSGELSDEQSSEARRAGMLSRLAPQARQFMRNPAISGPLPGCGVRSPPWLRRQLRPYTGGPIRVSPMAATSATGE